MLVKQPSQQTRSSGHLTQMQLFKSDAGFLMILDSTSTVSSSSFPDVLDRLQTIFFQLLLVKWHEVIFFPEGMKPSRLYLQRCTHVPAGQWAFSVDPGHVTYEDLKNPGSCQNWSFVKWKVPYKHSIMLASVLHLCEPSQKPLLYILVAGKRRPVKRRPV